MFELCGTNANECYLETRLHAFISIKGINVLESLNVQQVRQVDTHYVTFAINIKNKQLY